MDKRDYSDPSCCFDHSDYSASPDLSPCPSAADIKKVMAELDELISSAQYDAATEHLNYWRNRTFSAGDWRSELSIQSELMGLYRRTGDRAAAAAAVKRGLELVHQHGMGSTVSGATVMLNAATTMKFLGRSNEAIPIFVQVSRVYSEHLDPADYRFAGLFNNMALAYQDIGELSTAEQYFLKAAATVRHCPNGENELAVTYCNLAELYELMGRDDMIEKMLDEAWGSLTKSSLPQDGYHAFTISKCLPTFEHFGFFIYEKALKKRLDEINERT